MPILRYLLVGLLGLSLSACCSSDDAPQWLDMDPLLMEGNSAELLLADYLLDDRGTPEFSAESTAENLVAWVEDDVLRLEVSSTWDGTVDVQLTATDRCEQSASTELPVSLGSSSDDPDSTDDDRDFYEDPCAITLTYEAQGSPDSVFVAGTFNRWDSSATPMEHVTGNTWELRLDDSEISPGPIAYKFVELQGTVESWTCDPRAEMLQCDEGYKSAYDTDWVHDCGLDNGSCNSMLIVEDFDKPRLWVDQLSIGHQAGTVQVQISSSPGCSGARLNEGVATIDGEPITGAWTGDGFQVSLQGLEQGRHTLRFDLQDQAGNQAEQTYIPFWIEDHDGWESGLMYYAFLDRMVNGDGSLDRDEGASYYLGEYMDGDFLGLKDALPYLEDLGVTVIWISNPQDNTEGGWSGDCGSNFTAYHGYWPDDPYGVEEHFGDQDSLSQLVEEAHERGIRVVMDWVCNHVHQTHPYYTQDSSHQETWFNDYLPCQIGDDYSNFDDYPETCWFADYLPDINFYNVEPLYQMVEDALYWVKTYELDGFRVDGAKHVPHSTLWNLNARLDQEVEHGYAGGDENFYTVGETFSFDRNFVVSFVNEDELDAQFDFPLYGTIRDVFVHDYQSFYDLQYSMDDSRAVYGDALMSTFLGNHDVSRFISYGNDPDWADNSDSSCYTADVVEEDWWYGRLNLAWTYLLTNPGIPMIYYGDELGMPGNQDPDNRHPLWWYADAIADGSTGSFDLQDIAGSLYHPRMEQTLDHVAALGQARKEHPALYSGDETNWWLEADVYAYARVTEADQVLVILNRSSHQATLQNSLSFAALDPDGTYEDILTGETFNASGDWISISVPANDSRVLVLK